MAFDGITIANIVNELSPLLVDGRINKIAQPESDELIITIKGGRCLYRLLMSANASLPLLYLTEDNKPSPLTAPGFCMLLRKHINSGRILAIRQFGLERVVDFEIEHYNEMGDLCVKHLIIELMGKHSNIIFCDDKMKILDSIKHVSAQMSSVREVLPGRDYFIPDTMDKTDPQNITYEIFSSKVFAKPCSIQKALYTSLTGFSPCICTEICHLSSIGCEANAADLSENERIHLFHIFEGVMEDVRSGNFHPNIIYQNNKPVEYASIPLTNYSEGEHRNYESICALLSDYYAQKNTISRIHQRSADLRKIVNTILERDRKKLDLLERQLEDTTKRDKYKVYGELINAYGYGIEEGSKSFRALNYYTNEEITIPLDDTLTARENAQRYFERYNKLKRTFEATSKLITEVSEEIKHLDSISNALDIALAEEDLSQIKEELVQYGYIRRKGVTRKVRFTSKPFHYISSDGFHIYVGKNNFQNDELSFQFATGGDWWFHAKEIPGSHVIVKTNGKELPDRTFEEAAALAAHYSKGKDQEKVEVDYTLRKNLKKPNQSKPGFVIYHTNYSMVMSPDLSRVNVTLCSE
ncbi:MAG: NFACT family protein [Lachnospiraceae bacterium]